MRARVAVASLVVLGVTLTACTSSDTKGGPAPTTASPSTTAPTTPTPTPTTPAPTTTAPPATSASASPTTSAAPVQQKSTCTSLMIRILRGSAAAGREFAALQFTNTGSTTCMLYGYPTVTLTLDGQRIGSQSRAASTALSSRRLAPGDTAEAQVNDFVMNCTGRISDTLHVVAPGGSQTASRPVQLRACALRVEPLGAPE